MTNVSRLLLLLALTLLLTGCGGGRGTSDQLLTVEKIEEPSSFGDGSINRFPRVRHPHTTSIADSINSDLVREMFGIEWSESMNIFDEIRPIEGGISTVNDLSFQVIENNSRILALAISGEGCGAYCEPFSLHFNYDVATGRRIPLSALFTERGLAAIADSLKAFKRNDITDFLAETRREMASGGSADGEDGEDKEYVEEMITMYDDCLSMLDDYEEDLSYTDFAIDRSSITFYLSRCSNHAMRALDELGDFSYRFDIERWKHDLTPYGKKVLGE